MIISVPRREESKNAIIQLSQGMASGVLRGEEFNSIMENGSRISKMLADYLKVDIGQLREMAKEGKITSETMIKAFQASADTIENEFSKMQPTIDQAMTNLKTVFGRLLSDSNKSAEGTKSVAEEIMKLADTIEKNKPGIIELFTQIISLAGKAAVAISNIGQSFAGWAAVKKGDLGFMDFATMGPDDLKKWLAANDTQEKRLQNRIAKLQQKRAGAICRISDTDRQGDRRTRGEARGGQERGRVRCRELSPFGQAENIHGRQGQGQKEKEDRRRETRQRAAEKEILQHPA
jgi:tape measure domain-containing protein